jgi:endonuclease G
VRNSCDACPQVHSFNDVAWGDLEDWILSQEQTRASKANVFTGPIFGKDDPAYTGVQVPLRFYKIVAVVDDAKDRLSATAFVRDQIADMPRAEEAPFDSGRFSVNQVTLADLEAQTNLDFSGLRPYDPLAAHHPQETAEAIPMSVPLAGVRDSILWTP